MIFVQAKVTNKPNKTARIDCVKYTEVLVIGKAATNSKVPSSSAFEPNLFKRIIVAVPIKRGTKELKNM